MVGLSYHLDNLGKRVLHSPILWIRAYLTNHMKLSKQIVQAFMSKNFPLQLLLDCDVFALALVEIKSVNLS